MNKTLIVILIAGLITASGVSVNALLSPAASPDITHTITLPIPAGMSYNSKTGALQFFINITQNGTLVGGWSTDSNASVYAWFSPSGSLELPPTHVAQSIKSMWKTSGKLNLPVKAGRRVEITVFWQNTSIFASHVFKITQTVMLVSN